MSLLERLSSGGGQTPPRPPGGQPPKGKAAEEQRQRGQLRPDLLEDKARIHAQLVELSSTTENMGERDQVRTKIVELTERYMRSTGLMLSKRDFDLLVESLVDDVLGLGPLEGLLADPDITEIMINNPQQVYIERKGRLTLSDITFESDRQLRQVIDRVVSSVGRRV